MTTRIAVLLFVFLFSASAGAQTVTFGEAASPEGVTRTQTEAMDMTIDMFVSAPEGDQNVTITQSEANKFSETIHSVEDGRIQNRTVVFTEAKKKSSNPMAGAKDIEYPVIGTSYEILASSPEDPSKLGITRTDGVAVSAEALSFLEEKFKSKDRMRLDKILGGRTMSVGESLSLEDEEMNSFMSSFTAENMEVQSVSIFLKAVSESAGKEVAVLGVEASVTQATPVMDMEIAMDGTVNIFVETLWPERMDIKGTIIGAGSHGGIPITADGTITMTRTAAYEK